MSTRQALRQNSQREMCFFFFPSFFVSLFFVFFFSFLPFLFFVFFSVCVTGEKTTNLLCLNFTSSGLASLDFQPFIKIVK